MGKKAVVTGIVICLGLAALLQMGKKSVEREMDVISSISMNNGGQIREHIAVLLNDFPGDSENKIRKEILRKYDANTFHSIRFNQCLDKVDGCKLR